MGAQLSTAGRREAARKRRAETRDTALRQAKRRIARPCRFGLPEDELLRTNNLRDAELRHGRLAMLAAAAWPIQELAHPSLAKLVGAPELLSDGRSPSILNGGLVAGPVPAFLLATAAAIGYLDVQAENTKAQVAPEDWIPGYYGFDPLNIVRPIFIFKFLFYVTS